MCSAKNICRCRMLEKVAETLDQYDRNILEILSSSCQCFALTVTVQLEPSPCPPLKALPLQPKELDPLSVNGVMNHLRREHNSSSWKIKIGKILEDMSVLGVDSIIFVKQKEFSKVLHVCFLVHFLSPFPNELIQYRQCFRCKAGRSGYRRSGSDKACHSGGGYDECE